MLSQSTAPSLQHSLGQLMEKTLQMAITVLEVKPQGVRVHPDKPDLYVTLLLLASHEPLSSLGNSQPELGQVFAPQLLLQPWLFLSFMSLTFSRRGVVYKKVHISTAYHSESGVISKTGREQIITTGYKVFFCQGSSMSID